MTTDCLYQHGLIQRRSLWFCKSFLQENFFFGYRFFFSTLIWTGFDHESLLYDSSHPSFYFVWKR